MADLILKKTDFLKTLSKKQKMSSGEEGSMAAVIDAAKLRQVVSWMNNVEELINSKLSSYLPLSGGNIYPGPLEYRGKSVFTNDSYIVDSRLSSNIARISDLNSKINEIELFIKQISSDIEENTDDKISGAINVLSGTVDSKLTAAIQDLENEMSGLSGVLTGDIFDLSCELKNEINTKLVGVYRYKGTVTYVEELADLETAPIVGDCWNILSGYRPDHTPSEDDIKVNPGDNAVWNGDAWDVLAGIVDVSNFATKLYVDETFATKQEVQEAIDKVHTHDNLAVLSGITAEQVTAWDASEQNAKNYTDEQVNAVRDSLSNYISKEDAYNAIAPEISAYNNFLSASPDSIADIIEWNRGLHTALFNLVELFD